MLHTLCDKFDKIYGIIYTKNTSSDRGNLNTSKVCRLNADYQVMPDSLFFAKNSYYGIMVFLTIYSILY